MTAAIIPLPSWHRTTFGWARDPKAPAEVRAAAIAALAEANSPDLCAINDPEGIRMVSEARNRRWANAHSEIIQRPAMLHPDMFDPRQRPDMAQDEPAHNAPMLERMNAKTTEQDRRGEIWPTAIIVLLCAAIGLALLGLGLFVAKAVANAAATAVQIETVPGAWRGEERRLAVFDLMEG